MTSNANLRLEFAPPANFIDSLRIHLHLSLLTRRAKRAARYREDILNSLDAQMLYDIGVIDAISSHGLFGLANHDPHPSTRCTWNSRYPML